MAGAYIYYSKCMVTKGFIFESVSIGLPWNENVLRELASNAPRQYLPEPWMQKVNLVYHAVYFHLWLAYFLCVFCT